MTDTMAGQVFRLPDLGEGLTEAGLVQWLVTVGDTIAVDQAIAEVETAKSVVELPSPFAGVVTALHGTAGDTIAVGAPVLEVAPTASQAVDERTEPVVERAEDETKRSPAHGKPDSAPPAADSRAADYREEERAGSGNVLIGYGTTQRASGRRRRPAASPSGAGSPRTPAPAAEASGPGGRTLPVAVRSPLVRRLARDLGLDVNTITPTGADGAITRSDVLRAAVDHAVDGAAAASSSSSPADHVDGLSVHSRERMSPLRKAASAKLSRSRSEIPEATVWVDVDATRLWEARAEMAPVGGKAPSITALIARFSLLALEQYPLLAARLSDDATEIIRFDGVNLGVAADTERGLMVPVLPRAHEMSVDALDSALRELTASARSGRMPPERLRGSTFTLNNYGGLGVDGSAAIINHPDVAILGIGRIVERPWVVDGAIVPRRIAQVSLVFDHRVCDGGYAAGFLRTLVQLIEHPLSAFGRI